jgi:hypothetical protein
VRPELTTALAAEDFRNWYWLKKELADFCLCNGLPAYGSKADLTGRIALFLATGEIGSPLSAGSAEPSPDNSGPLSADTVIPAGYRNTETVRAWFRSAVGKEFRFNVPFMNWMRENTGVKTFGEAVDAWREIRKRLKTEKLPIADQFEYNRYTRDFFADNPGRSRHEAVRCWNHKKSRPGHNRYERGDLTALTGLSGE